ncbi:MAG: hypothetical protein C4B58_14370 [Deltaproteobacteria bacterium]|nr:MAG: hypothetical protein C4B58_14370 [Deltaproteobacteria bacterium]
MTNMALPKKRKKLVVDVNAAVQKAAKQDQTKSQTARKVKKAAKKTGRPSPRSGNVVRQTLLLSEETAERLTIAFAAEQIKRRKVGEKVDKSLLIEEMIVKWLDKKF